MEYVEMAMQLFNMAGVAATAMASGADMEFAAPTLAMMNPPTTLNANQESFELWDEFVNGKKAFRRLFLEP
jgi:hypothetical protein